MSYMNEFACAKCEEEIYDARATGESSLYYSGDKTFLLCEDCFLEEEEMIEETGTNDHPEMIKMYEKNVEKNG